MTGKTPTPKSAAQSGQSGHASEGTSRQPSAAGDVVRRPHRSHRSVSILRSCSCDGQNVRVIRQSVDNGGARHRLQGARQQPADVRSDVVVASEQIRGPRQFGLRPTGQVGPGRTCRRVVPPDPLLGGSVDLDVTGVQLDRRVAVHQWSPDMRRDHPQPAGASRHDPGNDSSEGFR